MKTISEQSSELTAAATEQLPTEVTETFTSVRKALADAGVPEQAVSVGDKLPAVSLLDEKGETRTLDELAEGGPIVIVFYRGGWCPYCNIALRTYQADLLPHLDEFSARLVAISPEAPDESLSTQEKDELEFTVLSDEGARFASSLGITFEPTDANLEAQRSLGNDIRTRRTDHSTILPMPTVLIVDQDQVVRFADIRPDYTGRTEVDQILAGLRAL